MWERTTCELCPAHQSWSENPITHPGMAQTHLGHWLFDIEPQREGAAPVTLDFLVCPSLSPWVCCCCRRHLCLAANCTPPGPSLAPISVFLVGLVPVHSILDVFQTPLAPNMLFLLEGLILLTCLIAELTSSLSTQIPWTFGTFPTFSQGLDSTEVTILLYKYSSIYLSLMSPLSIPWQSGEIRMAQNSQFSLTAVLSSPSLFSYILICVQQQKPLKAFREGTSYKGILFFVISCVQQQQVLGINRRKSPQLLFQELPHSPAVSGCATHSIWVFYSSFTHWVWHVKLLKTMNFSLHWGGEGSESELVVEGRWFNCKFTPQFSPSWRFPLWPCSVW